MKSISEITLYDLMAEDLDVWLSRNKKRGFNLEIDDDRWAPIVREEEIHPCAVDSFASFCRRFLSSYEQATKEVA